MRCKTEETNNATYGSEEPFKLGLWVAVDRQGCCRSTGGNDELDTLNKKVNRRWESNPQSSP